MRAARLPTADRFLPKAHGDDRTGNEAPAPALVTDYSLPETTSAAEVIAAAVPGARVVGAFKNTWAAVFDTPQFPEGLSDVLVTGDDPAAKALAMALFADAPFRLLDAGALSNSRTVERMTLLSREPS